MDFFSEIFANWNYFSDLRVGGCISNDFQIFSANYPLISTLFQWYGVAICSNMSQWWKFDEHKFALESKHVSRGLMWIYDNLVPQWCKSTFVLYCCQLIVTAVQTSFNFAETQNFSQLHVAESFSQLFFHFRIWPYQVSLWAYLWI